MTADRLHMIKSLKCHKWDEKGAEKSNHQQTNFYFIIKFFLVYMFKYQFSTIFSNIDGMHQAHSEAECYCQDYY